MDNLIQLQQQLQKMPDNNIQQALSQPGQGIGQLLVMLESDRRREARSSINTGQSRPQNIREEMAQGIYKPVPSPTVPSVEQGGLLALMPQGPAPQATLPQGVTSPTQSPVQPGQGQGGGISSLKI